MKIGDLVIRKNEGISHAGAKKYLGRVGIITHVTPQQPSAVGLLDRIHVMFDDDVGVFLERYLEVVNESR